MYHYIHIKLGLIKGSHANLFTYKEKGGGIGGRGAASCLNVHVEMLCSFFSVSAPILLSFDSQAFSGGKKKKSLAKILAVLSHTNAWSPC